ncbi:MAG: hypothetical protein JNM17_34550 [Archangium sp.]|nr:hypothetical protein [Archangium sp.]
MNSGSRLGLAAFVVSAFLACSGSPVGNDGGSGGGTTGGGTTGGGTTGGGTTGGGTTGGGTTGGGTGGGGTGGGAATGGGDPAGGGGTTGGGTTGGGTTGGGTTGGGGVATAQVTVTLNGNGAGVITSMPNGVNCPGQCSPSFPVGTNITLSATAVSGSSFVGWTGPCTGMADCQFTLGAGGASVIASFAMNNSLVVSRMGNGSGTVTSSPGGITCGNDCSEFFAPNTMVSLTAIPDTGSVFSGWSGACAGMGSCGVTTTVPQMVTASFSLQRHQLTVNKMGTGTGLVVSTPAGITCGTDCNELFDYGTMVSLVPTPSADSDFAGWGGACTGMGACDVTIAQAETVTAFFALKRFDLTVTKAGTGTGTVNSVPTGVACGPVCTGTFDINTMVTLTASESSDSTFTGWSGACTGTGACIVNITAAASVTATFTLQTFTLSVAKAGLGGGVVTSTPAGINCGSDCDEVYNSGTMVQLDATQDSSSTFAGWSGGGCVGTGPCIVSVTSATTVTATFNPNSFLLTVIRNGTGTGNVIGSGINCGAMCLVSVPAGGSVSLSAMANAGSGFAGWSGGGCTGTGGCTFMMNGPTTISATFNSSQLCSTFNVPNTTTVPGWTERAGDWVVDNGRVRDSTGAMGTIYSRVMTQDGSTFTNGCVRLTAFYSGAPGIVSLGAVLRWSAPNNYVVALVQDNTNSGTFNSAYIYQYPAITDIGGSVTSGAFGTNPNIEACINGAAVTFRIDANRDGTYETTKTGTTTLTTAGLAGVMALTNGVGPSADDVCSGP